MPYVITPDNIRISYFVAGKDESIDNTKTIIFAHGNGNCKIDWLDNDLDYVNPLIAAGYRLILVDERGYGESEKPREPKCYTPKLVASDLNWPPIHPQEKDFIRLS